MENKVEIGRKGEMIATKYLLDKDYFICDKNWHYSHYEIDIVARKNNEIVFIEVKTRKPSDFEEPEDAVDLKKIKRLVVAADNYIKLNNISLQPRFDIIAIIINGEDYKLKHIEDAFYPPLC
ncbi:MAG: YraN family protein [Bacteroidales bacterium]|nr:YraN family protein [Bacteroidales bacterium]